MTRLPDTTADNVVGAAEAVLAGRGNATAQDVANFLDLPLANAIPALELAEDLGLIRQVEETYEVASPLARLLSTPILAQRAAVLRVAVESYQPYFVFRERLHAGAESVSAAAQQTRALLDLTEHREVIKQTLVSLGTYCQSLRATAGGKYEVRFDFDRDMATQLQGAVSELAEAELRVRDWLSEGARSYVDMVHVLQPLAESYFKVSQGDSRGAIVTAGNAVESHLSRLANDMGVDVANSPGLGAKVAALDAAKRLPKKLVAVGRYLGNVRNAADHGIDPEIGAPWNIRSGTGEDFLRVAVTFIDATTSFKDGHPPSI